MAAVEITISGVLYDKYNRTQQNVVLIGEASLTGLQIGGGPMPPGQGGGGSGAHPEHPIYYPPGIWGPTDPRPGWGLPGQPPGIWGGGNVPMPTPPIANAPGVPPSIDKPPEPVQPPIEWKAVWHPTEGWVVVGIPNIPHPTPSST